MQRNRRIPGFETMERRLPLSAVMMAMPPDDEPLDDPEGDPGDLPVDDNPIVLPPVPPSGPVGPGMVPPSDSASDVIQ